MPTHEETWTTAALNPDGRIYERRSDIVIEGKPLLCGPPDSADPLAFPESYISATVQEAQDALRAVKGARAALVSITIRVQPSCEVLGEIREADSDAAP